MLRMLARCLEMVTVTPAEAEAALIVGPALTVGAAMVVEVA